MTYGLNPDADVLATNIRAGWPARLSFNVTWRGETVTVSTRLLAAHQAHSALAAIAAGLSTGLPLADCAHAVSNVEPEYGRMWPTELNGTAYIVDCWKAPHWTMDAVLDYMAVSRAKRKVLVIGSLSDIPGSTGKKYRKIAKRALEVSDIALFTGPNAKAVRELSNNYPDRLAYFERITDAREWLRSIRMPGDLILLKGSSIDHLERLFLDHIGKVECWINLCKLIKYCKDCRQVGDIQTPAILSSCPESKSIITTNT